MTAAEKRAEAVRLMKSRAGRNTYTQGGKRAYFFGYPNEGDDGYSDCSSSVRACIKRASGVDPGSNTNAQLRNAANGVIVDETDGYYPDESKLLPGDLLYFKGNTAHYKDVGHVEMYTGPNECWGHGSGKGPKQHDLKAYCKKRGTAKNRYFCAIRWIKDDTPAGSDEYVPANPVEDPAFTTIRKGSWHVRDKGDVSGKSLGYVKAGDAVYVYGKVDGWYAIKALETGLKGWVSGKAFAV